MNLLKSIVKKNIYTLNNEKQDLFVSILISLMNNGIMILVWVLIFSSVKTLKGYNKYEIILQYILVIGSLGMTSFICGGTKNIPNYIKDGQFEYFLLKPKNTVLQMVLIDTEVYAVGEILFSLTLFAIIFQPSVVSLFFYLLSLTVASITLFEIQLLIGVISFYLKDMSFFSQFYNLLYTFSTFPSVIFNGIIKIILIFIIPVFFYNFWPSKALITQDITFLTLPILFNCILALIIYVLYNRGRKRYISGSNVGFNL